ncbi:hypothetical protein QBC32DRAFT_386573 [Pseudoneurospora amorphoporcata]|uniref:Retrotransposon gag domain-containing protein n=1 Tax=Pseudoneurospora amorphoporcata TaxID=241081 RepID=A0AAN6NLF1_9PEZI|nr:hypothetical protein QBC32DRAFT_386573 [Pseudoneurospora amorphoporcata]
MPSFHVLGLCLPRSQNAFERQQHQLKLVFPYLDKFTEDKKELDTWIYTAEAKLYVDGHAIGDLEAQFYYLYSSLSPTVRRTLFAFAQILGNCTPARLLEKLRVNYREVNQDKKAGLELFTLQQKSREPITSFLVRFEEWLGRLRERPDALDSYSELCAYLRRLDGNNFLGGSTGHSSAAVQDKGEPIEIAATRIRPAACGSTSHWSKECPTNQGQTRIWYIRATESDGSLEEETRFTTTITIRQ